MSLFATTLLFAAATATNSPLVGTWAEIGGTGAARIERCAANSDQLCATGLARRADGKPGFVDDGLVLTGIIVAGKGWKGTYLDGNRKLPAELNLESADKVRMKVCLLFMCQTARYARVY